MRPSQWHRGLHLSSHAAVGRGFSPRKLCFRLSKNARSVILRHRREALKRAEDENRAVLGEEGRKSPKWLEIKNRVTEEAEASALLELGIAGAILQSPARQDVLVSMLAEGTRSRRLMTRRSRKKRIRRPKRPERSSPTTACRIPRLMRTSRRFKDGGRRRGHLEGVRIRRRARRANAPPDALIEREQIPQKWLRVPVDLGALRIDLSQSAAEIDRDLAAFNAEMTRRIEAVIDAWQADADPTRSEDCFGVFPAGGEPSRGPSPPQMWSAGIGPSPDCERTGASRGRQLFPFWNMKIWRTRSVPMSALFGSFLRMNRICWMRSWRWHGRPIQRYIRSKCR